MSRKRTPSQLSLDLAKKWGGARKGAGRKPKRPQARRNVPHVRRPPHKSRFPTLVTLRARHVLGSLRRELVRESLRSALWRQSKRTYASKFHVVEFTIQDDHLHLIVEGQDRGAKDERDILRRGLTGLASSLARLINKVLKRRGPVWADRHHRRDLTTPTEVRHALVYVLNNWKRHGTVVFGHGLVDPFSSAERFAGWSEPPIKSSGKAVESGGGGEPGEAGDVGLPWPPARPRTWLLNVGWREGEGLLDLSSTPATSATLAPVVRAYLERDRTQEPPISSRADAC